jgi:hypothetical protein
MENFPGDYQPYLSASLRFFALLTGSLLGLSLLSACSGSDLRPYPDVDRLEIVASTAVAGAPTAVAGGDLAETIPDKAAVMVPLGATSGLLASFACGPWFAACAAFMIPGTAIVGTVEAVALEAWLGLSREEADKFNAYFEALPKRRDLNRDLVIAVAAGLPEDRLAATNGNTRLVLGVESIIFNEPRGDFSLSLALKAKAHMEWDRGQKQPNSTNREYRCNTDFRTPNEWLADEGAGLDEAINLCLQQLARQVSVALRFD